jgi:hypothetical protein
VDQVLLPVNELAQSPSPREKEQTAALKDQPVNRKNARSRNVKSMVDTLHGPSTVCAQGVVEVVLAEDTDTVAILSPRTVVLTAQAPTLKPRNARNNHAQFTEHTTNGVRTVHALPPVVTDRNHEYVPALHQHQHTVDENATTSETLKRM